MKHEHHVTVNTIGVGIYCCQVPEAATYNDTGSQPLAEITGCVLLPFLFWLFRILKQIYIYLAESKKLKKKLRFSSGPVGMLLPPLLFPLSETEDPDAL